MKDDDLQPLPDEDALAERGRLLVANAVSETRAPLALRERLERDRAAAGRSVRARRRLWPFAVTAGALVAVALVALVVGLGGRSGGSGPSVLAVARVALGGANAPAPRPTGDGFVAAKVDPVRFPDWQPLSWPATGQRTDRVGGREVRTVYYRGVSGATAAYSIVAGEPIRYPEGARERRVGGTTYRIIEADGDRIVSWEEGGRTCVLRAPAAVPEGRLIALASWAPA